MKGNYESENKFSTGKIIIGVKPTLAEFKKFTDQIDSRVIDLVMEYLDVKDCFNDAGMKLSAEYNKKVAKGEIKVKKVVKKINKKTTKKKKVRSKKRDSTSQILGVLGGPDDMQKQMKSMVQDMGI